MACVRDLPSASVSVMATVFFSPGNEAEQLEFVGFAVLRFLIGVTGEIRIAVRMHGIGDGNRVVGSEIHIQ